MNYCDNKCVGCIYLEVVSGGGWCHISGDCKYTPKEKPMTDKLDSEFIKVMNEMEGSDLPSKSRFKEKPMSEKTPITKKQAERIIYICKNFKDENVEELLERLKDNGHIVKSELETLVEDAEDLYSSNVMPFVLNFEKMGVVKNVLQERLDCIHKLYNAIQAFKTKYPEWNK